MGQGNTVALTASTGKPGPPPTVKTCEELGQQNDDRRDELKDESEDKTIIGIDEEGQGTTVSSGKIGAGGGSTTMTAHSRQKANERLGTLTEGGKMSDRKKGKSGLSCPPAKPYKHPSPSCQKSGHAEARIIDAAKPPAGSRITFNIDWRPRNGDPPSKMPCETCHGMICYAVKECKMQIYLCDQDGKPQKVTNKECPANAQNYQKLKTKMGE